MALDMMTGTHLTVRRVTKYFMRLNLVYGVWEALEPLRAYQPVKGNLRVTSTW